LRWQLIATLLTQRAVKICLAKIRETWLWAKAKSLLIHEPLLITSGNIVAVAWSACLTNRIYCLHHESIGAAEPQ